MISVNSTNKCFYLEAESFSYVLRVNEIGFLTNAYFGKRIPRADLSYPKYDWNVATGGECCAERMSGLMQEYATYGLGDFREPALIPRDERGSRIAELAYLDYELLAEKPEIRSGIPTAEGRETLVIRLGDRDTGLQVKLYYTVYEKENILTRRAEIVNETAGTVTLEKALSLTLDLPEAGFELLTLWGHNNRERQPERTPLRHGRMCMGNTRNITSHQASNFMALLRPETREESGEVYAAALMYSGAHYEAAEEDEFGRTRLSMGIQPEGFAWTLQPGESFETPEAVLCYTDRGLGQMSRQFHDFYRSYVISPRWVDRERPVVLNSWEGMFFDFDEARLFDTIDGLKDSGIDTFVLDDGWFGARNSAEAGLGDWYPNRAKLPGGLAALAERCRANGLRFGFWIEPEMVNPDSDLYRAHPDWAIGVPGREPVVRRHQLVLDLTRREVLDWVKQTMADVIRESGASYVKWDMNRPLTENFSQGWPAERQGELLHRYVLGVYELAKFLTESFPEVFFEGCSSGGGRFDGAMLRYFPQIWTSDNTDAESRMKIQYGTSLVYPLSASSNHVSRVPSRQNFRVTPRETRRNVAYNGSYGYEFDIRKIPQEEFAAIKGDVERYRSLSALIRRGDLYRGSNRTESNEAVLSVVAKDKSEAYVTFYAALNCPKHHFVLKIPGLAPERLYRVEGKNLVLPGAVLERVGLTLPLLSGDFASFGFRLTAED